MDIIKTSRNNHKQWGKSVNSRPTTFYYLKCTVFNHNNNKNFTGNSKIQKSVVDTQVGKNHQQKFPVETQTLDLMDEGFESVILNMIKEVKEIMSNN